jgi:general secretion pathway protein D
MKTRKIMKMNQANHKRFEISICAALMLAAAVAQAQFAPGAFPAPGSASSRTASRSSTTTSYPSSTDIGQARITYDPETRSVIVVADEDTAAHITNVVNQLDRPTPQVLIKCVFMEATYTKGTDIGVEGLYKQTITTDNGSGVSTAKSAFNNLATTGGIYTFLGRDLEVTLAALAQAGKTEVLSRPSILARNNQQATITIGQEVPLITGVSYDSFGNQRNAISYTDVGIILQVTPFITSDGMVEMIVAPQISRVSDSTVNISSGTGTNNGAAVTAPIIDKRAADTVVVVPDGQTVVIGGLMQNRKVNAVEKVPVLGDIPLLGFFFRHKVTANEKTELLIFMTPYIVNRPTELAARATTDLNNSGMMHKAFGEEELDRFLDRNPSKPPKSGSPSKTKK